MNTKPSHSEVIVQLFNESVLGSAPCDAIPNLLSNPKANWTPKQIILDYKDNACYGGIIHYDRSQSFESLRRAFNERFHAYENPTFANDSSMGIWRLEDKGFAIQLSVNEDEDRTRASYRTCRKDDS